MALGEVLESDLDKALECPICFNEFTEPKQLTCLHNFCMKCLKDYCNAEVDRDNKPCPLCRREFSIPQGGIEKLPNNDFLARITLMRRATEGGKKPCQCEICTGLGEEVVAESFCLKCKQYLCDRCRKCHSLQTVTVSHNVVDLGEKPSEAKRSKMMSGSCTKHSNEEVKIYCSDCSEVLCYVCLVLDHGRRNYKLLEEVVKEKRGLFSIDEVNFKKCYDIGCDELKRLGQERDKTSQNVDDATAEIDRTYNDIINQITACRDELLEDLATRKDKRLKEIEGQEGINQQRNTEVNSLVTYGRMMMERGTDCEIIRVADELHKRAEELIKSQDENNTVDFQDCNIKFLPSAAPSKSEFEKVLGKVLDTAREKRLHCAGVLQTVTPADADNKPNPSSRAAISATDKQQLALADDKIFIVSRSQAVINVYDFRNLTALYDLDISYVKDPQGIAGCSHMKYLYVCDHGLQKIHRLGLLDNTGVRYWNVMYPNLRGVSVTSEHRVLITAYHQTTIILEFTSEGYLMRGIRLDGSITEAWQAAQLSVDEYVICQGLNDTSSHRLCVVDSGGQIIKSFGAGRGGNDDQLDVPCSMAIDDKRGRVFIADFANGRILMFSEDLEVLGQVQATERLRHRSCLYFDADSDRLIVGDEGFDSTGRMLIVKVPDQSVNDMKEQFVFYK